jgi:HK97 family phage major capsid protein
MSTNILNNEYGTDDVVQKADLRLSTLAPAGLLNEQQSQNFIRVLQERSRLLGLADVQQLRGPKQTVENFRFASRITRRATEATSLPASGRVVPDFGKAEFDVQELIAEVNMSQSALEDNIENKTFENSLLEAFVARVITDLELAVIQGDTALVTDDLLSVWDGMLKSATSNIYNAAGSKFTAQVASDMLNTLPNEFKNNREVLRFMLDHNSDQNARNSQASRATQLGDAMLQSSAPVQFFSVPLLPCDVWPNDLGVGLDETEVILTSTKNIAVGIWRRINISKEWDPRARTMSFIATLRADFTYIFEPAVVKGIQVKVL